MGLITEYGKLHVFIVERESPGKTTEDGKEEKEAAISFISFCTYKDNRLSPSSVLLRTKEHFAL